MSDAVRPLELHVDEADLDDLRDRLRRVRWPEQETVRAADGSPSWQQGPPGAHVRELVRYWAQEYDWRRLESELGAHGQAVTRIDGLDVHLLHARSPRPDARPLVITHGWPSSVVEPLCVLDALTDPPDLGSPAFHVVAPSLPGFGLSGKPDSTGWTVERTADAWAELMRRLGYERFCAAGGDWGGRVTTALAHRHADRVTGVHTFTPYVDEPVGGTGPLTGLEDEWVAGTRRFVRFGGGYSLQQSTRPQTLAYGLTDSPVAQLTWILDKVHAWTDAAGIPRDRLLDTVTLYWLTASGGSSARFYWDNFPARTSPVVEVPSGVTVFPADIERFPRHWVEQRFTDLRYWNVAARGGHFPMLEVPDAYVHELRECFGSF